ncbi:MAG: amino acid carrier protein [Gammaproteobacteria bacterium]|jgi:AGCS family alanine or glycine:cation symporter|nr:amino acid carrier protein [Gammaproteobacteria bacterium]MBT4605650.1 amino acid carrier protein [Thiotrichales bacterium]MBT3473442.1 amino acid carrier protein [Gammaproteobacteria bacterium]MBT4079130.1 amino acid carrier protein [Gammaproteobacteria bacterium]MBT4329703.1 amino acid carrier protein [Gammaproteobacteria bacterium]
MDLLVTALWNPLLTFLYLEIGLLLLLLSRFAVWRKLFTFIKTELRTLLSTSSASLSSHQRTISSRFAFITALSSTVGVGNLAGVSTAIHLGGPGALFWMWVSALVGMGFRMSSTWLALHHQPDDPNHPSWSTPMSYLDPLFKGSRFWGWLPALVAVAILFTGLFANAIQTNSVAHALHNEFGASNLWVATLMALLVAVVILGGLQRIVQMSVRLMPWVLLFYIVAALVILLSNPVETGRQLITIIESALSPWSVAGGVAGYTVLQAMQFGVSRGVFSHGSGLGFAPFLHAANREGARKNMLYAALVPAIDTLFICTITGLVVLSGGYWMEFNGAYLTTLSFEHFYGETGKWVIVLTLTLFAFTSIINLSYFAERCYLYLRNGNTRNFRYLFILITFLGPLIPVALIWSMADLLIAVVLIFHLPALLYLTIRHLRPMLQTLNAEQD